MAQIKTEWYCRDCEHETHTENGEWIDACPKCGSENLFRGNFIICPHCNGKVYVDRFTNICPECETMYNASGDELAPPEEWDEEDRYACFGPQNVCEDY